MTGDTTSDTAPLDACILAHFQRCIHGELIIPGLGDHDRQFALIARCLNTRDVAVSMRFAVEHGLQLEVAVCSDNHGVTSNQMGVGVLLVDLSQMRQIVVDPLQQIAQVEPGVTHGELVQAAAAYGLAIRDNVLAVGGVTADGRMITTSADQHPELFQAFRDGGNIGVVTTKTYKLYPLSTFE